MAAIFSVGVGTSLDGICERKTLQTSTFNLLKLVIEPLTFYHIEKVSFEANLLVQFDTPSWHAFVVAIQDLDKRQTPFGKGCCRRRNSLTNLLK